MDAPALFWLIARFALLCVGLLAPGEALMRALRLPRTIATCFAGSALSLYVTVLVLQFAGITVTLGSLAAVLGGITVLAAVISRFRLAQGIPPASPSHKTWFLRMGWGTPLYVLFWAAVLLRVWRDPLAGPDIEFRWSFLAEQMLRLGSLDFYPPRSAQDFLSYFWVESIPPGVSALHAWAYACAGVTIPAWTAPAILLQIWSLHELLWRTAERVDGLFAARITCLAAAACPLLTWSVVIGQETGLTTLAIVGMAYSVHAWQLARESAWAALLGLFAALGASAREYGLIFPVLAAGALIAYRADRRAWTSFLPLALISVAWPLRTWVLTGSPFYSLPFAGLPVNERFQAWIEHDAGALGAVLQSAEGWRDIARYLLLYAPAALLGWLALLIGTIRGRREAVLTFGATIVMLGLWVASVRFTNGGLFYSMRVTSPALALGALSAGVGCTLLLAGSPRPTHFATGGLVILVVALLPSTLALPQNPWRTPWQEWPAFAKPSSPVVTNSDSTVGIVLHAIDQAKKPGPHIILTDAPGYQRRFRETDVRVIPLWSPQADWLFDASLAPADAVRRWKESGVSHIVITKWQANLDFFNSRSSWSRPPFRVELVGESKLTAVFAIQALE